MGKRALAIFLVGIACFLVVGLGAVVSKQALHHNALVPPEARECALENLWASLDNPIENVLLSLGGLEVVEATPEGVIVASYTLWQIELSRFLVVCERSILRLDH